ncbi:esterase-like activity of phytase family protein [Pseudomonas sp. LS44]|uniref:esterase-like activity of phytase family protein n=1 Tax=Pseudomonas sp. LS44 TaxID=1357074 RepID=UPI00215A5D6C|nr:esterase-like activity of phytase family protein [Pseudomonas sp. LS44]UVE17272.1 esterase-like activity of phytase family protein [Pseudomonas sp. LS44]
MTRRVLAALLLVALPAVALAQEELKLSGEYPVEGMPAGNLSGLTSCGDGLWAVSDREDDRLYRLSAEAGVLKAEAERFEAPPVPPSGLPGGLRMRAWVASQFRGGALDFEGLSCDAAGNRYLVSETHAAVLKIPPAGSAEWLALPASLVRQARVNGMLSHFNALFEGVAIDPQGSRLWLAAERERRGLLVLHKPQSQWACKGGCVLISETGTEPPPAQLNSAPAPKDFSDLTFFADKLYSLERQGYRICRRSPVNGEVERCWSFAAEALNNEARRYGSQPFGMAEGLWLDATGAWIALDTGQQTRQDGEQRPIIWHFAAPAAGWGASK